MFLDLNDPTKIISKLDYPILEPIEDYEKMNFWATFSFNVALFKMVIPYAFIMEGQMTKFVRRRY